MRKGDRGEKSGRGGIEIRERRLKGEGRDGDGRVRGQDIKTNEEERTR